MKFTFKNKEFGDAILRKRTRMNKSLQQVCDETGMSMNLLFRAECGNIPKLEGFIIICTWLKIAPGNFYTIENA